MKEVSSLQNQGWIYLRPASTSPFPLGSATLAYSVAELSPESWLGNESSTSYSFYISQKEEENKTKGV